MRWRASIPVAAVVAGLLVWFAAGSAVAAAESPGAAVVSAGPEATPNGPAASSAAAEPVEEGGGDQDGDAGRPKTTASGPGFLAVLGLVLAVIGFRKFRRRRAAGDESG